jgi:2-phospho-L-lactate/phosphoenolpyruvate guanylyltransferase
MRAGASWAIVPVKTLTHAKRRLASHLPAAARRQLVLTMLEDVLAALAASAAVDRVLVVSPDARVADLAARTGAMVLREEKLDGLNAAVRKGLRRARAGRAERALVLPADVPLATAEEIGRVLACTASTPRVRLVASADGEGTNALLLAPPDAIAPGFGRGSFARHVARASTQACAIDVLQLPGLASDIDCPSDLAQLLEGDHRAERYAFVALAREQGARQTALAAQGRFR